MRPKRIFTPKVVDDVPEVTPEELKAHMGKVTLVDVRGSDEFNGELAHIPGSKLVTLGPELDNFFKTHNKQDEMVFVCRSGARSGRATLQGRAMGFSNCVNLQGGMLLWNQKKFPVERGQ